ncbi:MAG: hypothetical protein ACP5IE_04350 [Infirmifilum sp.]
MSILRKLCIEKIKNLYIRVPVLEKFGYVAPFICAFDSLNKSEFEFSESLENSRIWWKYKEELSSLKSKLSEYYEKVLDIVPGGVTDLKKYIAFQLMFLYATLLDVHTTFTNCFGKSNCIENAVSDRLLNALPNIRNEPYQAFHGLHFLQFLMLLTFYEGRDGRESVVFRALRMLTSGGSTHRDKGQVEKVVSEAKKQFGKAGKDRLREWHQWFLTYLGGLSLTSTWDFTHLNNILVKWLFGEVNTLDEVIEVIWGQSATRMRPGMEIDVRSTTLGRILVAYLTKIRFSEMNEKVILEYLRDISQIYFVYGETLLESYEQGLSNSEKALAITERAMKLHEKLEKAISNSKVLSTKDLNRFISINNIEWDLITFLMRRSSKTSFEYFWLNYPRSDIWRFDED